jgi:hypothetical protein
MKTLLIAVGLTAAAATLATPAHAVYLRDCLRGAPCRGSTLRPRDTMLRARDTMVHRPTMLRARDTMIHRPTMLRARDTTTRLTQSLG